MLLVKCGRTVNELGQIIRAEISMEGAISFARFMDLALYHPARGYYRGGRDPFGVTGDFYTAEQLPVFGWLVAHYVDQLSRTFEPDARFEVLELGAGRGELREFLGRWNYRAFDRVGDALPAEMSGLVIANEFFDALPVHLLRRGATGWRELRVNYLGDRFVFVEVEKISLELAAYAERYGEGIPEGGMLEVNLQLKQWIERVDHFLRRGRLLVIDYGYSARELERFPMGTLMSYRGHAAYADVLSGPGTRDITAHVNFSQLSQVGMTSGFQIVNEESLQAWALRICETDEWMERWKAADTKWRLQWKQLVFGMGETFRVMELEKEGPQ